MPESEVADRRGNGKDRGGGEQRDLEAAHEGRYCCVQGGCSQRRGCQVSLTARDRHAQVPCVDLGSRSEKTGFAVPVSQDHGGADRPEDGQTHRGANLAGSVEET